MDKRVSTNLTVCPIRAKPDDASEMITQILYGESAIVLERAKKTWTRIKLDFDGYEGWVDSKQLFSLKEKRINVSYCVDLIDTIFSDHLSTWITLGAELNDYDGMISKFCGRTTRFSGQAIKRDLLRPDVEMVEKLARKLINVPYLWGGRTPFGIDCSGLTQLVYKCVGFRIDRDAKDQAKQGQQIDFVSMSQPGDLAFFSKMTDQITHVGIVLPDEQIIHASGKVRIDTLDHYGIFNKEIQEYTHRLKIIKRYF